MGAGKVELDEKDHVRILSLAMDNKRLVESIGKKRWSVVSRSSSPEEGSIWLF